MFWSGLPKQQAGLTLAELMIALVISMLLMTGVISVFVANKQTYLVQDALARVQENARFAVQAMVSDIRSAGYFGCNTALFRENPGNIRNTLNGASGAGGYLYSFSRGVDGFEAGSGSWAPVLDPVIAAENPSPGSDIITVRRATGAGARVLKNNDTSASTLVSPYADIEQFDIAMVSDCSQATIFQVTDVQTVAAATSTVVHNTGSVTQGPGNASQELGSDYVNADLVRILTRSYFVAPGTGGEPALYRMDNGGRAVELVEGVEQLQVLYGVDTSGNRNVDVYQTADAVANWANVMSVQVSMVVRSPQDNVTDTPQTYQFQGAAVTAGDNRLRQVFSATVAMRNNVR